MRKSKLFILSIISSIALIISACSELPVSGSFNSSIVQSQEEIVSESSSEIVKTSSPEPTTQPEETIPQLSDPDFSIEDISPYSGQPYTTVNNNIPYLSESDLTTEPFEIYSELDDLGRCGVAYANICVDIMPIEERGEIGQVRPSGWHTVKYNDIIDGNYLYNRCHLIGYQLAGENANVQNLITGTRYLNVHGMLPFENQVTDYVKETSNHVLYRVTPIFKGDNLVASGVLMEAESVEDKGDGILFCVYVYNVQPGIIIDYATGESWIDESIQEPAAPTEEPVVTPEPIVTQAPVITTEPSVSQEEPQGTTYILNTNTKKFHYPSCSSVGQMKEKNKKEYTENREDVISMGYDPCKWCNP